jgi:hypothetical protein
MAIRVQLPNSKKPVAKADAAFSDDRAAALTRLAKPSAPAEGGAPGAPKFRAPTPAMPAPSRPAMPIAATGAMPSVTNPAFPLPRGAAEPAAVAPEAGPTPGRGAALPLPGTLAPAPVAGSGGTEADPPPSEALLDSSGAPDKIRAFGFVLKWGLIVAVLLGVGYAALRFLVPFVQEMSNPTPPGAAPRQDAPTAVRMLQETRAVVAKNNANVAHVNDVVAAALGEPTGKDAAAAPPAPKVAPKAEPAKRPAVAAASAGPKELAPFEDAISRLKIGGVTEVPEVRVYLDGRIVKFGEIVDRDLAIRFMGVDTADKMLLFTNADNVLFRRPY